MTNKRAEMSTVPGISRVTLRQIRNMEGFAARIAVRDPHGRRMCLYDLASRGAEEMLGQMGSKFVSIARAAEQFLFYGSDIGNPANV